MQNYISRFRTAVRKATSLNIQVPDELVAFLMLRKSALGREDRRLVLSSAGGVLDVTAISVALKNLYPDEELKLYDKNSRNRRQHQGQSNLADMLDKDASAFFAEDDADEEEEEAAFNADANEIMGSLADAYLTK